jgi:AcrR family transcriptional regulator
VAKGTFFYHFRDRSEFLLALHTEFHDRVFAAIASRNKLLVQLSSPDFAAMGWAHPAPSAAMWNSAVVEAALLELGGG